MRHPHAAICDRGRTVGWATALTLATGLATGGSALAAPAIRCTLAPVVEPLSPSPGAVLPASGPRAYVAAHIAANAPIRRITLRLDGRVVAAEVTGPDEGDESLFYQPRRWRVGRHHIVVTVWDVTGQMVRRTWSFRVAAS